MLLFTSVHSCHGGINLREKDVTGVSPTGRGRPTAYAAEAGTEVGTDIFVRCGGKIEWKIYLDFLKYMTFWVELEILSAVAERLGGKYIWIS